MSQTVECEDNCERKLDRVWQDVVMSSQNLNKWTENAMGNLIQRTQYKGTHLN